MDSAEQAEKLFATWRSDVEAGATDGAILSELLGSALTGVAHLSDVADRYIADGNPAAAVARLNEALMLSENNPWLLFQLGRAKLAEGDAAVALDTFRRGLDQTDCAPIKVIASRISAEEEKRAEIRTRAQEQIKSADELFDAREWQRADALLQDADVVECFPEIVAIKRANIAITLGNLNLAEGLLKQAERDAPRNPWVPHSLGLVAECRDDLEAALVYGERAVGLDPENGHFQRSLERWSSLALTEAVGITEAHISPLPMEFPEPRNGRTKVICWDVSHNPAGRAAVLADVATQFTETDLVGPSFTRTADLVWPPLAQPQYGYGLTSWAANGFADFVNGAIQHVMDNPVDHVWVSKARFPSLFMGCLYKLVHGTTMIVDIDDDELAFVEETLPLTVDEALADEQDLDWVNPAAACWGRLAQHMVSWADGTTCCNRVLQNVHGGEIIPHVRRGEAFAALDGRKSDLRADFGIAADDKVVLFMGTPRRHKGILDIARAVKNLSDPAALLLVVGSFPDTKLKEELDGMANLRWKHFEDQPLSSAPVFNAMADLACAVQHTDDRIAQSQTPAKLSDAAGAGTLAITSKLSTVAPFVEAGAALTPAANESLVALLRRALVQAANPDTPQVIKSFFSETLSVASAVPAAKTAFQDAQRQQKDLPVQFVQLLELMRARLPMYDNPVIHAFWDKHVKSPKRAVAVTNFDDNLDIVFFWKQNDTGIYNRRQDCIHETLAGLPNVRKVLHIDAPINADRLMSLAHGPNSTSEGRRITDKTLARFLGVADGTDVHYRSFVHKGRTTSLLGRTLPSEGDFAPQVARWMEELEIGPNALAWVCPVVPEFDKVQEVVQFQHIVCDVIDDQRLWPMKTEMRRRINRSYAHIFDRSSCVFANCEPVVEWLRSEGLAPVLVPNGLTVPDLKSKAKVPSEIKRLTGPIVGYVGNMSDRIDWALVHEIAVAEPSWQFVFIGKTPNGWTERFQAFADLPNVLMPGVVPADQVSDWLAGMDAAIIPHLNTPLSEAMNPLKLYVYRSHGVRTVSTPIKNIDDLRDEIAIAANASEMRAAIAQAIQDKNAYGPAPLSAKHSEAYNWESRVAKMLSVLRDSFRRSEAAE
ncbi:hypothetical protein GCM10007385_40710 [Tateyamaria omphalii]|uniref:glycosyltransferase n=1 Tax=Tateyamaria omphalii TaxID=299262 RepID=UPI00167427E6|nr:glycosyltransferase [Tateyamaria omphalii]GGX67436.1 hypothetical protein GCM10007385_40710 [Tateyamaria omphalii]